MAFGNSFDFNIESFEQLEILYNKIKPIREKEHGVSRDIRPINSRNQKHVRVEKIDVDTYACVFYDTKCVIYHRNGELEVRTGGYHTQSTTGFINACMPMWWQAYRHQSMVHIYDRMLRNYYIVGDKPVIISNCKGGPYEIVNAVMPTKRRVMRAESKAKRAKFQPFLTFARGFMEVLGMDVPRDTDLVWGEGNRLRHEFFTSPETFVEDDYLKLLSAFVHQRYHPMTFAQVKAEFNKEGTVYERVDLYIGARQCR
jgi:hypothetical protein